MSLKDRLRSKKEAKAALKAEQCEFKISIKKVTDAAGKVKNVSDLGNIVKEFSKFLSTLASEDAKITFSGSFDLGQRTLLNCVLAKFLEDEKKPEISFDDDENTEEPKLESKLIKKRKSVKAMLKEAEKEE